MKKWEERNDFLWILVVVAVLVLLTVPGVAANMVILPALGFLIGRIGAEVFQEESIIRRERKHAEDLHKHGS